MEKSLNSDNYIDIRQVYLRLPQSAPDFPYREYQSNPIIELCEYYDKDDSEACEVRKFQTEMHTKNLRMIQQFLP